MKKQKRDQTCLSGLQRQQMVTKEEKKTKIATVKQSLKWNKTKKVKDAKHPRAQICAVKLRREEHEPKCPCAQIHAMKSRRKECGPKCLRAQICAAQSRSKNVSQNTHTRENEGDACRSEKNFLSHKTSCRSNVSCTFKFQVCSANACFDSSTLPLLSECCSHPFACCQLLSWQIL